MHEFENANISYDVFQKYDRYLSIRKFYDKSHFEKLIKREIMNRRDQLIITNTYELVQRLQVFNVQTASIENNIQNEIQALITSHLRKNVKLVHLTFRLRKHQKF